MRRRLSLRARMVVITAAVVTVVLTIGGVILLAAARAALIEDATDLSRAHAMALAAAAVAGDLPAVLPLAGNEEDVLQVVAGGAVVAASANVESWPPLALPEQPPGTTEVDTLDELFVDDVTDEPSPYRVVAHGFDGPTGPATVFVAFSLEEIEETVAVAARVGALGLPVLVLVLSAAMWVVVGRTLAPVEAIRAQTEEITGSALDRRVPEPAQQDEIGRLARTVNAMLGRLQDSAERQRRFVADAAHELRSPIASLRAQLEVARRGVVVGGAGGASTAEGVQRLVPDLLADTLRMERLVDQLLLLASSEGAPARLRRSVDVDDVIDAVLADSPDRPGVSVDVSAVHPAQVIGVPTLLEQLVRNLVDNAAVHARSEVRIGLKADGRAAVLTVADDGPGIPVERRAEIFHPFTRLDGARDRASGGVGLGLAIVADIVRSHGGTVAVETAAIGGAEFQVRLPLGAS